MSGGSRCEKEPGFPPSLLFCPCSQWMDDAHTGGHAASRLKGTSGFFHCCASQEERVYFGSQSEGIAHHKEEVLVAGVRDGSSHCNHSQEARG